MERRASLRLRPALAGQPPVLAGGARAPWRAAPGHRGGMDPDPEGTFHTGRPGMQIEPVEPADLGFVIHDHGAASDKDAPPRPGPQVIVVGLEGDQVLFLGRGELGPAGRAEDHVLAVHGVVHRQEHYLAVRVETEAPYRNRGEQPQAHVEGQGLEPSMIGRLVGHVHSGQISFAGGRRGMSRTPARCLPSVPKCHPGPHVGGRDQPPGAGAEGPLLPATGPNDERAAMGPGGAGVSGSDDAGPAGSSTSNTEPWPSVLLARAEPWWASAIACTMARPSPKPPASRVRCGSDLANRWKIRSRSAAGIPDPESATDRMTCPFFRQAS